MKAMGQDARFQSGRIMAVESKPATFDAHITVLIRRLEDLLAERKRLRSDIMPTDPAAQLAARLAGPWPVASADDAD